MGENLENKWVTFSNVSNHIKTDISIETNILAEIKKEEKWTEHDTHTQNAHTSQASVLLYGHNRSFLFQG